MNVFFNALVPVVLLITLGHLFRRWNFPGSEFWPQAERFTYYVLFPAMLVYKLGQAHMAPSVYADVAVLVGATLASMTLMLVIIQRFWRWSGPLFSSVFQGAIRFNSYVALAAGGMLLGDEGLALTAVVVAIMVPMLNLLCIVMFSLTTAGQRIRLVPVLRMIITNPLIVGSLLGITWGYFELGFHPLLAGTLGPLSSLALPMGLMTVGAGLQLSVLRGASTPFVMSSILKLLVMPVIAAGIGYVLGFELLLVQVMILLAALPTATSAYILARQLGGDAPLMAGIISGQTLLAVVSIPLVLSFLW